MMVLIVLWSWCLEQTFTCAGFMPKLGNQGGNIGLFVQIRLRIAPLNSGTHGTGGWSCIFLLGILVSGTAHND